MLRPFEEDLFVSSFKDDDDGDDGTYYHYLKTTNYIILLNIFFTFKKHIHSKILDRGHTCVENCCCYCCCCCCYRFWTVKKLKRREMIIFFSLLLSNLFSDVYTRVRVHEVKKKNSDKIITLSKWLVVVSLLLEILIVKKMNLK